MKALILLVPLALAAFEDDKKAPPPPAAHWTAGYVVDCDSAKRTQSIKSCMKEHYTRNGALNPELEEESFSRCRLAADVMYCKWSKP